MVGRNEEETPETKGHLSVPANSRGVINLVGAGYSPDLVRTIERAGQATGLKVDDKYDRDVTQNAMFRCDHFPFLASGVPAVWVFGGFHPGYHEPSDTMERIDFDKLERVARLAFLAAREVANGTRTPRFRP